MLWVILFVQLEVFCPIGDFCLVGAFVRNGKLQTSAIHMYKMDGLRWNVKRKWNSLFPTTTYGQLFIRPVHNTWS